MNKSKIAGKEAIIAVINDQLSKSQPLRKQVYLTEVREKHENALRCEKILRTRAKDIVDKIFNRKKLMN